MSDQLKRLINDLSSGGRISDLLPNAILIAKRLNQEELEKWLKLELHGYYDSNQLMTEKDVVPNYRTVSGLFYDMYKRPLIFQNPNISFVNEIRLRNSISELEGLNESSSDFIKIVPQIAIQLIKENFNFEVHYFSFPTASIKNILDRVRMETLENLIGLEIKEKEILPKNKKEFKQRVNALVIKNKLQEALDLIASVAEGDKEIEKEIILQKAKLNDIAKRERLGFSKSDEISIQKIRISAGILELGELITKE